MGRVRTLGLLSLLALALLLAAPTAADQQRARYPHVPILIEPGHGGEDWGVSPGASRTPEKDLTLAISLEMAAQLRADGVPVALMRETDSFSSISQRVSYTNALFYTPDNSPNAGRMLSIHLNSNLNNPNLSRVEIRVPFDQPAAWPLGLELFEQISAVTGGHYGFTTEGYPAGVHPADLAMSMRTYPQGYNILTESLFLSNAIQAAQVADPDFQRALAAAHVQALREAVDK